MTCLEVIDGVALLDGVACEEEVVTLVRFSEEVLIGVRRMLKAGV